jgi:hypothetical protein
MSEPELVESDPKPARVSQSPDRPYHVGDPLPNAMTCTELMRALNLKEATFYAYQKAGKFKRFEFRRPVSYAKRYSGALVTQYLLQAPFLAGKK